MTSRENNRLDYLDVLRGVAALAVLVQHVFGYLYHTNETFQPLKPYFKFLIADMVDWGRFGVVLFFLISGFIIPHSLKPGTTLNKFVINRTFRLYPAYWLTLVLIIVSAPYLEQAQSTYSIAQFAANVTMVPKLFGIKEMSDVFWTLFIEVLFYGCCIGLFTVKWLDKPICMGLVAIGLNLTTPVAIIFNNLSMFHMPVQFVLFHLSFLFAGNLLRLALIHHEKHAQTLCWIFMSLCCLTVPLATGLLFPVIEATRTGFVMFSPQSVAFAYSLAIGLFIYAIYFKTLNNKFMVGMGEISYSLYLLHMLCFVLVAKFISFETFSSVLTFLVASAFLTYWVAKASFTFVEYPAIRFGKKIIQSRGYL